MGLLDDPELQQLLQQLAVTQQQKKQAGWNALSQAGFSMMGARKGQEGAALGRAGLIGTNAFQNNLAGAQQGNMQQMQLAQMVAKMQQERAAQQAKEQERQQIGNIFANPGQPTAPQVNPKVAQYRQAADYYAAQGNVEAASKYAAIADKMEQGDEYSPTPHTFMRDGKPVTALINKRGGTKTLDDLAPKPEFKEFNDGQQTGFVDPLTRQLGPTFQRHLTPEGKSQDEIGRANLRLRAQENAIKQDANNAMREVGGGQANRELGNLVTNLRKEYNALEPVKNFRAAAPIAASAAKAPDTPAGDLDLIYAVGKVLDPGSVVREGEMNLVIKSGSPLHRFQGYVRAISQGKGRLPPGQRKELLQMLEGRVGQLKADHDRAAMPYATQAQRMNLPRDEIFGPPTLDDLVDQYTR